MSLLPSQGADPAQGGGWQGAVLGQALGRITSWKERKRAETRREAALTPTRPAQVHKRGLDSGWAALVPVLIAPGPLLDAGLSVPTWKPEGWPRGSAGPLSLELEEGREGQGGRPQARGSLSPVLPPSSRRQILTSTPVTCLSRPQRLYGLALSRCPVSI